MRDQQVYLVHILECIEKIERYTSSGKEAFMGSETHQDAVLRNLQVLCESTQRLENDWKVGRPEVDWRRVSDFRNRLVHDYLGIDLDIVWSVVREDLPHLKVVVVEAITI